MNSQRQEQNKRMDEIESQIAERRMSVSQCFTQMRQVVQSTWQAATEQGDTVESYAEGYKEGFDCCMNQITEQGVGEPVAWWNGEGRFTRHPDMPEKHCWEQIIPLYTHPHKPTGGGVPEGLVNFARGVIRAGRGGLDVDGLDIHDYAVECGLLEPYEMTEKCGDSCPCADVSDFPVMCYRETALLAT